MAATIVDHYSIYYGGGINNSHTSISDELILFNPYKVSFVLKKNMN